MKGLGRYPALSKLTQNNQDIKNIPTFANITKILYFWKRLSLNTIKSRSRHPKVSPNPSQM